MHVPKPKLSPQPRLPLWIFAQPPPILFEYEQKVICSRDGSDEATNTGKTSLSNQGSLHR